MKRILLLILLLLFSCLTPAFGQTVCPDYTFAKIVDTATPVPGGNGGTFEGASLSEPAVESSIAVFSGAGGGVDGVFAGDGNTLGPVAAVGDPVSGGGTINTIFADFAFGGGAVNIIALPSSGDRGIYGTAVSGLSKIVDVGEPAPGGGVFSTIFFVSRQGTNLAFQANIFQLGTPARSNGVFTRVAGVNELVADSTTVIPGSAPTTFSGFSDPDISGQNVAFRGGRGPLTGVYARIDGTLTKVADINDIQPGSAQSFTTVSIPVISGRQVAFRGVGDFGGIYVGDGGPLTVIAQTGDPAPGGSTFSGFGQNVSTDGGEVAFSAGGSGFSGLFVSGQSGLCRVIDTNDTLESKDITQLFMGRDSYAAGMLGFRAVFSDGSQGIYLTEALYTLSLSGTGNGSVRVNDTLHSLPFSGQFSSGAQVQLEAIPDSGWSFSAWSGDLTDSTNLTTITMDSDKNVTATFLNDSGTGIEDFITRFYQLFLDRDPDAAGLDGWVNALVDGTLTGSDVGNGFVFSAEFLDKNITDEEYVRVLYEAFFNRQPDSAGLQGWLDALANGSSRKDVLNGFIFATEFAELSDSFGIKAFEGHITSAQREAVEAFVTRFYQLCLDRDPDAAGLKGWTDNLLNQTQTGADVGNGFIFSQEFISKNTTNEEYLTILYKAFFDRDPDQAGRDVWLAELNGGIDRSQVLDGFLGSQEFIVLSEAFGIDP